MTETVNSSDVGGIKPELIERMVALVRRAGMPVESMPGTTNTYFVTTNVFDEARAIVAELPEPVDPDLVLAREAANSLGVRDINYRTGGYDQSLPVRSALAAIKRVRAEYAK